MGGLGAGRWEMLVIFDFTFLCLVFTCWALDQGEEEGY